MTAMLINTSVLASTIRRQATRAITMPSVVTATSRHSLWTPSSFTHARYLQAPLPRVAPTIQSWSYMLQGLRAVSSSSAKGGESSPATIETPIRHHPQPIRSEFAGPQPVDIATLEKIDAGVGMHRIPISMSDWTAYGIVKFLRIFADLFFQKRYVHRAVVLETVAAVPGMVAGMLRHLTSLRRMRHDGGWISHLLAEAENERLHLLTWMKTAHRMVGYLEEEAVISYTEFLKEIDNGNIENGPAPEIAKDYWNLMDNAKLREVVLAVRADEANHRDMNHHFADRMVIHQEDLKYPVTSDSLKPIVKIVKTEAHKA
ncbi:hypothetical protein BASA83_003782 [Batrachochytrium salamandrivorans]|nr:hypothetical protein BASA83_003782 [Batrachochytrium salamandrivorans]